MAMVGWEDYDFLHIHFHPTVDAYVCEWGELATNYFLLECDDAGPSHQMSRKVEITAV